MVVCVLFVVCSRVCCGVSVFFVINRCSSVLYVCVIIFYYWLYIIKVF